MNKNHTAQIVQSDSQNYDSNEPVRFSEMHIKLLQLIVSFTN